MRYLAYLLIFRIFLSGFVVVAIIATLADEAAEEDKLKNKKSLLLCFSLKRNCEQLFSFKRDSNDIAAVHGIRMLNSVMLLLSHKSMALFFSPYSNRFV